MAIRESKLASLNDSIQRA